MPVQYLNRRMEPPFRPGAASATQEAERSEGLRQPLGGVQAGAGRVA
jgi:hypothetical protein